MENKKEKLFSITLKDCDVQAYKGSGAGGQKRNKTSSAIRLVHKDSGAVGQCENYREQSKNKAEAFKRMSQTKEFKTWVIITSAKVTGKLAKIEEQLEHDLKFKTKVEVKDAKGRWVNEN